MRYIILNWYEDSDLSDIVVLNNFTELDVLKPKIFNSLDEAQIYATENLNGRWKVVEIS